MDCIFTNTGKTKTTAPAAEIDIGSTGDVPWNQGVRNVVIKYKVAGNKYHQFLSHDYQLRSKIGCCNNIVVRNCAFEKNCDIHIGGITFEKTTMEKATLRDGGTILILLCVKNADTLVMCLCHYKGQRTMTQKEIKSEGSSTSSGLTIVYFH